jgi:hypothetical protein
MLPMNKRENANTIVEDITPAHLRCGIATCPGILILDNGNLLVIGKRLSEGLIAQIGHRVSSDEYAIEISPEFFQNLGRQ